MASFERAVEIANEAHKGQKYGEFPYVIHCMSVANRVSRLFPDDEDARVAAMLHDVIEDTEWSAKDLLEEGFSDNIVGAVVACTRNPEMTYNQYIDSIVMGVSRTAKRVKLCDALINRTFGGAGEKLHLQLRYDYVIRELLDHLEVSEKNAYKGLTV